MGEVGLGGWIVGFWNETTVDLVVGQTRMEVSVGRHYLDMVFGVSNLTSTVVVVGSRWVGSVVDSWIVVRDVGSWSVTPIDPVVDRRCWGPFLDARSVVRLDYSFRECW